MRKSVVNLPGNQTSTANSQLSSRLQVSHGNDYRSGLHTDCCSKCQTLLYMQLCLPVGAGEELQVPARTQQLCIVFDDS